MANYPQTVTVGEVPYLVNICGGANLSEEEVENIAELIHNGKAVRGDIAQLRARVRNAHLISLALWDQHTIVGAAALKNPTPGYREKLKKWTNVSVSATEFPAELGYVVVSEKCRGADKDGTRLSSELMKALMTTKTGKCGVFSTTKVNGLRNEVLPALGFSYRASYHNDEDQTVHLLTKAADT